MRTKEELFEVIANRREADAERAAAGFELQTILSDEMTASIRHATEVFFPAVAELVSELKRHREVLAEAAKASDRTGRWLVAATWALGAVTLGLVCATGALVAATIYGGH